MDDEKKALLQQQPTFLDIEDVEFSEEASIIRAVNRALNLTAHLNNLLPTGTMLAFQVLCPIFSNGGQCDHLHKILTAGLLTLCGISSFVLSFTDSFRAPNGKIYYGFATPRGLWAFGSRKCKAFDTSRFSVRFLDFVHGIFSVLVVVSLGLANFDVVDCFYPEMPRIYMNSVPVVAGFVISMVFVLYPSQRRGIGHASMYSGQESMQIRYYY
ncbi:protein DMP4 isoform X1 [Cryptomeria japonica]|uniref:protein DMP4 isoform X1 n=1 Tax=Cryptomeria japonica TaxID=3369 RepID=UPI0027DA37F7|nr:protein DMP4 isoform X1 [Cryptomeria japonica]